MVIHSMYWRLVSRRPSNRSIEADEIQGDLHLSNYRVGRAAAIGLAATLGGRVVDGGCARRSLCCREASREGRSNALRYELTEAGNFEADLRKLPGDNLLRAFCPSRGRFTALAPRTATFDGDDPTTRSCYDAMMRELSNPVDCARSARGRRSPHAIPPRYTETRSYADAQPSESSPSPDHSLSRSRISTRSFCAIGQSET
jgi:hypothetical protein